MKSIYFALFVRNMSDHRNVTEKNNSINIFYRDKTARQSEQLNYSVSFKKSSVFVLKLKANLTSNIWLERAFFRLQKGIIESVFFILSCH